MFRRVAHSKFGARQVGVGWQQVRRSSNETKQHRARRAMMYLPGSNLKMLAKVPSATADAVCLDMEDGVGFDKKVEARQNIKQALQTLPSVPPELIVRINSVGTGLEVKDLEATISGQRLPDAILLPKVENEEGLQWIQSKLDALGSRGSHVKLLAIVETAKGMLNLPKICTASPRLEALIFGADDFAADVGAIRTVGGEEVWYARNTVLLHAAAYGLQAIDMVCIELNDEARLRRESEFGFHMGFAGKQVVHPKQVEVVHTAFSPKPAQAQWARDVVEGYEKHRGAAFLLGGKMIDAPTVKQAFITLSKLPSQSPPPSSSKPTSASSPSPSPSPPASTSTSTPKEDPFAKVAPQDLGTVKSATEHAIKSLNILQSYRWYLASVSRYNLTGDTLKLDMAVCGDGGVGCTLVRDVVFDITRQVVTFTSLPQ